MHPNLTRTPCPFFKCLNHFFKETKLESTYSTIIFLSISNLIVNSPNSLAFSLNCSTTSHPVLCLCILVLMEGSPPPCQSWQGHHDPFTIPPSLHQHSFPHEDTVMGFFRSSESRPIHWFLRDKIVSFPVVDENHHPFDFHGFWNNEPHHWINW